MQGHSPSSTKVLKEFLAIENKNRDENMDLAFYAFANIEFITNLAL